MQYLLGDILLRLHNTPAAAYAAILAIFAYCALEAPLYALLLPYASGIALYANRWYREKNAANDEKINMLEMILESYSKTGKTFKAFLSTASKYNVNRNFRIALNKYWLDPYYSVESHIGDEFSSIFGTLELGIRDHVDISKNLHMLVERARSSNKARSKITSKTNGMHTLTAIGLTFFFPMFSGISSTIVRGIYSISSTADSMSSYLLHVTIVYVAVMLFVYMLFSHMENFWEKAFPKFAVLLMTAITIQTAVSQYLYAVI